MSKLKNILLSVFLSASAPYTQPAASADKAPDGRTRPATEIVKNTSRKSVVPQKKDRFAKYREAEKIAIPALVFFEGCSRQAYQDACKIWTVGIGNTVRPDGSPVTSKDFLCDNDEIRHYVIHHIEQHIYPYLDDYVKRDLKPYEMAAVISLTYNCGVKALGSSNGRIAKAVNKGNPDEIAKAFLTKVATRTRRFSNGLAVRRCLESLIYQNKLSLDDINGFYVGGYKDLTYKDITFAKKASGFYGRIPKKDKETLAFIRSSCSKPPEPELAESIAWYGGDKKVGEFVLAEQPKKQTSRTATAGFRRLSPASLFLPAAPGPTKFKRKQPQVASVRAHAGRARGRGR